MLASDLANPEFLGAKDPNTMLSVEFFNHSALDTWETQKTGIKSYLPECPYIRISIPGNDKTIIERPADNRDTRNFPNQWLRFQMETGQIANAENVPGWQIDEWDMITPDQARNLKFLRFYTVEQIAGASDVQIQGIGMGGLGLREKAREALAERNSRLVKSAVAEREEEIDKLKAQMAEQAEQMQKLMAMLEDKPKRGRPVKEEE